MLNLLPAHHLYLTFSLILLTCVKEFKRIMYVDWKS